MRAPPSLLLTAVLTVSAAAWGVSAAAERVPRVPRPAVPLDGPVDVDVLLRLARVSQTINARTYLEYSFRQTSRMEELDGAGETKRTQTKVYRVIPSRNGTIRHLLESDGEEPSARQVKKQRARNEKVRKRWEKIRAKQAKATEKKRAEAERRQAQLSANSGQTTPPAAKAKPSRPPGPREPTPAATPAAAPVPTPARQGARQATLSRTATAATPVVAKSPVATRARVEAEPLLDLPELPVCDLADPASSLRPPLPGSVTRSRRQLRRASDEARKARNSTGDYTIFELLSLTSYDYQGTCTYEDRAVHVLGFEPAEDFDPQNPVERVVTAMEGTIFIDASDIQVMRTEARTVAPIKWGAGLVALHSAHVIFESRKVRDEVWLPAAEVSEFDTRVVFSRERQRWTNFYDDYKKISVSSTEQFLGVVEDESPTVEILRPAPDAAAPAPDAAAPAPDAAAPAPDAAAPGRS